MLPSTHPRAYIPEIPPSAWRIAYVAEIPSSTRPRPDITHTSPSSQRPAEPWNLPTASQQSKNRHADLFCRQWVEYSAIVGPTMVQRLCAFWDICGPNKISRYKNKLHKYICDLFYSLAYLAHNTSLVKFSIGTTVCIQHIHAYT